MCVRALTVQAAASAKPTRHGGGMHHFHANMLFRVLIAPIGVAAGVLPAPVCPDPAGVIPVPRTSEARCEEEGVPAVEAVESVVEEGVPGEGTPAECSNMSAQAAVHRGHTATAPAAVHRGHTVTAPSASGMPAPPRHSGRAHTQCRNSNECDECFA